MHRGASEWRAIIIAAGGNSGNSNRTGGGWNFDLAYQAPLGKRMQLAGLSARVKIHFIRQ